MKPDTRNVLLTFGVIALVLFGASDIYARAELRNAYSVLETTEEELAVQIDALTRERDEARETATEVLSIRSEEVPIIIETTPAPPEVAPPVTRSVTPAPTPTPPRAPAPAVTPSVPTASIEAQLRAIAAETARIAAEEEAARVAAAEAKAAKAAKAAAQKTASKSRRSRAS
jgi:hypothetical protein